MKFEKVSLKQYAESKNMPAEAVEAEYNAIELPQRGTGKAGGYDFFSPIDFTLKPGESIVIKTGVRVFLDDDKILLLCPRSGLGFNFRAQLDNTVGVVDADYVDSDNEGHIMIKLTNDSHEGKILEVKAGKAIVQGIILQYFLVEDDHAETKRNGGFGSTDSNPEPQNEVEPAVDSMEEIIDTIEEADFDPDFVPPIDHHESDIAPDNKIILYTTHCPKCQMLERRMQKNGVEFDVIDDIDQVVTVGESVNILEAPFIYKKGVYMGFRPANDWLKELEAK